MLFPTIWNLILFVNSNKAGIEKSRDVDAEYHVTTVSFKDFFLDNPAWPSAQFWSVTGFRSCFGFKSGSNWLGLGTEIFSWEYPCQVTFLKLIIGTKKMGYFWMKHFFMKSRELTIIWTVPMFHLFQSPIHHLSALTVTYKDFQNGQKLMPIPSSCSNFRTCPNWHIYSCAEFDKSESV